MVAIPNCYNSQVQDWQQGLQTIQLKYSFPLRFLFFTQTWGISLQILCKQGRSGVTCQACVSLIESGRKEMVICTSNDHLHLYYKIASWSGALQWLCQLLSSHIQCTWWFTAALQWQWTLTLESSKDQISNGYHGSFIISMAYLSHSHRTLFIRQEINDAVSKAPKQPQSLAKIGAFHSACMTGS